MDEPTTQQEIVEMEYRLSLRKSHLENLRNNDLAIPVEMSPEIRRYRGAIFGWASKCIPKYLSLSFDSLEHSFKLFDLFVSISKRTYTNAYSAFHEYLTCLWISQKFIEIYPKKV